MKRLKNFIIICLIIGLQALLFAGVTVKKNPRFMTPDSIHLQIEKILELNKADHTEALCQTFGLFADINQDTLKTMISREFSDIRNTVNSTLAKYANNNSTRKIDANEVSLKHLENSINKLNKYEDFFALMVEVGAVPEGLKYLDEIFTKDVEILKLQQGLALTKVNNNLEYRSQGIKLVSEKIVKLILPNHERLLKNLGKKSTDSEVKVFINNQSDKLRLISKLSGE